MDAKPLLVFLEGVHDIQFLMRVSVMLHARDPGLPDLARCEQRGEVILVPIGGGDVYGWADRFTPLHLRQCHIYDREPSHETLHRQSAIDLINRRPNCRGFLTRKRSIENYLHREAIRDTCGVSVRFGDGDDVVQCVGRALLGTSGCWEQLSRAARRHVRDRVKRRLNSRAATAMTWDRLVESDPEGEVVLWLETIRDLLNGAPASGHCDLLHC